jgi:hypothetical protein
MGYQGWHRNRAISFPLAEFLGKRLFAARCPRPFVPCSARWFRVWSLERARAKEKVM